MQAFLIIGSIVAGCVILFLLDRLALWMESRGWIYWRNSKGCSTRIGNAFLTLQSILEPGKKYVIESRQEIKVKKNYSGDTVDDIESATGTEHRKA